MAHGEEVRLTEGELIEWRHSDKRHSLLLRHKSLVLRSAVGVLR